MRASEAVTVQATGGAYAGGPTAPPCDTGPMGFDPTRKYRKTRFDYAYVAASVVVCVAVVLWALLG